MTIIAVSIPFGQQNLTASAKDGTGNDISGDCTFTVTPSDPTALSVSQYDPKTFILNTLKQNMTSNLIVTATDGSGSVSQTYAVTVPVPTPASAALAFPDVIS